MPKLPRVTAREICALLEKAGFLLVRQSRSQRIDKNASGKRLWGLSPVMITVPFRASKTLHPNLLRTILGDAGLSPDDLEKLR